MSTATIPRASRLGDELAPVSLARIDVATYHRMIELGILKGGDPIELIDGLLVTKMTKMPPHIIATMLFEQWLHRAVPAGWLVTSGNPVTLVESDSEPEPDFMVARGAPRDYTGRKPLPADVALVVEVADASYAMDRRTKLRLYARGGLPHYWLLNINGRVLEAFSDPTGPADDPGYRTATTHGPDDEVPLVLDGREVARLAVRDVLP